MQKIASLIYRIVHLLLLHELFTSIVVLKDRTQFASLQSKFILYSFMIHFYVYPIRGYVSHMGSSIKVI